MVLAKRRWRCGFSERMKGHDRKHRCLQAVRPRHVADVQGFGAL